MRKHGIIGGAAVGGVLVLAAGLAACLSGGAAGGNESNGTTVTVLSGRADMVTGGDALVLVDLPPAVDASGVQVTVNGADVTAAFRPDAAGHRLVGFIDGLVRGSNEVEVTADGDAAGAPLTLVNHPSEGPVFSGPHQQPFVCETTAFELQSGEPLGEPLDEHCSVARRVDYVYRTAGSDELRPLPDPGALPADVATVTTLTGDEVPYVVRIETGDHQPRHLPDRDAARAGRRPPPAGCVDRIAGLGTAASSIRSAAAA